MEYRRHCLSESLWTGVCTCMHLRLGACVRIRLYARNADMRAWRGKIDSEGSVLAQEAQLRYVSVLRARRPASGVWLLVVGRRVNFWTLESSESSHGYRLASARSFFESAHTHTTEC